MHVNYTCMCMYMCYGITVVHVHDTCMYMYMCKVNSIIIQRWTDIGISSYFQQL